MNDVRFEFLKAVLLKIQSFLVFEAVSPGG